MSSYNEIFRSFIDAIDPANKLFSIYAIEEFTMSVQKICETTSEEIGICIVLGLRNSLRYCPVLDISFKNLKIVLINDSAKQEVEV